MSVFQRFWSQNRRILGVKSISAKTNGGANRGANGGADEYQRIPMGKQPNQRKRTKRGGRGREREGASYLASCSHSFVTPTGGVGGLFFTFYFYTNLLIFMFFFVFKIVLKSLFFS